MGVMDGRRFKFEALEHGDGYYVAAITTGHVGPMPLHVDLGEVRREYRSTDSRIAGTRLRRVGKGATAWSARVLGGGLERSLREVGLSRRAGWQLVAGWSPFRKRWDKREDAALALADWFDHPEKREAAA